MPTTVHIPKPLLAAVDRRARALRINDTGSGRYFWLRVRTRLLDIERRLGHADRTEQIEQELRQLLVVADSEFVLLRELN